MFSRSSDQHAWGCSSGESNWSGAQLPRPQRRQPHPGIPEDPRKTPWQSRRKTACSHHDGPDDDHDQPRKCLRSRSLPRNRVQPGPAGWPNFSGGSSLMGGRKADQFGHSAACHRCHTRRSSESLPLRLQRRMTRAVAVPVPASSHDPQVW